MADEPTKTEGVTPESPTTEPTTAGQTPTVIDPAEHARVLVALKEANKEAASRRVKLDAFEKAEADRKQAEMTESEKAAAKLKEYETKLAQMERAALVRKIADEAGLPSALADRLQGNTEDELKVDAAKLLELVPKTDPKKPNLQVSNPGNAERTESAAEKRERLMGSQANIWSGGGVRWPDKE